MAGVLVEAIVGLRPGEPAAVGRRVVGILDRELVEQRVLVDSTESLDDVKTLSGQVRDFR